MKILNGRELAGFIKERQAHEVRALRQAWNIAPKLAIIVTVDNPVIDVYVRLKQHYGADILIDVNIHRVAQAEVPNLDRKSTRLNSSHRLTSRMPSSA
jgi:5,10-methylene-tetrahydrofolate dehydrogenase/methenyl tetrahydrofolate cyclohydrolase